MNQMRKPACAVAALLAATPVAAQDAFVLDEIVFSASLGEVWAGSTGATVESLEGEEIELSGETSLAEALDTLPGVSVSSNGGPGATTTLRIRGLQARYAPVFLDGIELGDPSGTQQDLNYGVFTTLGIDRIEVLKGSQSALYGSEAVGGVIDITTALPEEDGTELGFALELGSYETRQVELSFGRRSGDSAIAFRIGRFETEGFSSAEENIGNTEPDGHEATAVMVSGEQVLTESVTLEFSGFVIDSETDQDAFSFLSGTAVDDPGREEARRVGARVAALIVGETIDHEISAQMSRTERYYPTGFTNNFEGERREFRYLGETAAIGDGRLSFGAQASRESFRADADSGEYDIYSLFGELFTPVSPDLDASLSLRADDHSEFGLEVTGRAALAWRPDAVTVVRSSVGTGFRAPSLFELFSPCCRNPALGPETSRSLDLGVERRIGDLTVKGTVFYVEIDDLIDFGTSSYVQVPGTSRSRGFELSGEYALRDGLSVFGNFTLTNTQLASGGQFFRVPEHDLTLGVRGDITDRLSGAVTLQYVADAVDTDGGFPASPVALDDYTLINASLGYEIAEGIELYGRIDNLTDEEYQTTRGYGTSDRAFYVGLRASF